jgi:aminoglycoside 6-adenylyltransferase
MRSEHEMLNLIIDTANEDERILAVYMNGSRTNSNVPKDIFQDYDIVYVVDETESFIEDKTWIDRFGERLYMHYPEDNVYHPSDVHNCYGWQMQFADGVRIDLHIETLEYTLKNMIKDKLCIILKDKKNVLPIIPKSTDEDYWVRKPTIEQIKCTYDGFWWCLNNVAKGLWRQEIPYVQDKINFSIRPQLIRFLSWKIGIETNFQVSIGKSGKYMHQYLPNEEWEKFLNTYSSYKIEDSWKSIMEMCDLFDDVSHMVCDSLSVQLDWNKSKASRMFLEHVRTLPRDAKEIY